MTYVTRTESVNITEHVLVCLSPSPTNRKIIDEAAELAKAFRASFTALYVAKSQEDKYTTEDSVRLQNNIRHAEDMGASITTVIAENIPFAIAEFARVSGVTKIVIGRSNTKRYHFWERQTVTEQLIAIAPGIDIYIIPDSKTNSKIEGNRLSEYFAPAWKDLMITAGLLVGMTLLGVCFSMLGFTESNIITVYIFGALLCAILTRSHFCSLISSICSVLLFNFFFTEPRFTFHVFEAGYAVTFIIMLIASLLTATLAYRLKDIARESAQSAFHTKVLFDTNQLLQKKRSADDILNVMANQVILLLNKDVIIFPVEKGELKSGYIYLSDGDGSGTPYTDHDEDEVVRWVLENKKRAGATTKVFSKARCLYLAIRINGTVFGIMGIRVGKKILSSFEYSILLSILGECALALENLDNEKAKEEASIMAQNEKLRANILRTISHDLRTPLTSISGNASNLCSHYKYLDDETREQIFSDIYDDSEWLIQLVENLLSVTRFENGEMKLNKTLEVLDDVVDEAIKHIDRNKTEHEIIVSHSDDVVVADMDAKLITQVIINLVNNAIKYTQKGSKIEIQCGILGDEAYVSVRDNGPGMTDNMKEHAYDMFYSGQNTIADGKRSMGLGLALCKSVVEAHNGKIEIRDNLPSGCIITFYLKKGDVIIDE